MFCVSTFTGLALKLHLFLHKSYFTSGGQIFTQKNLRELKQTSLFTKAYLNNNDLG